MLLDLPTNFRRGGWSMTRQFRIRSWKLAINLPGGDSPSAAREHTAFQQCARVLLMATKYPEGTKTEGYNPLVVVIAVDSACSPGAHFPSSIDDRDAIKEAAQQLVHAFTGTPFVSKGKNSGRAFVVQGH